MRPVYSHGGKAYIVLERRWEGHFTPKLDQDPDMERVKMYRDWIGADHVLRDQTHYLFCETIEDIEWEELSSES
jgi:hypothetical protein